MSGHWTTEWHDLEGRDRRVWEPLPHLAGEEDIPQVAPSLYNQAKKERFLADLDRQTVALYRANGRYEARWFALAKDYEKRAIAHERRHDELLALVELAIEAEVSALMMKPAPPPAPPFDPRAKARKRVAYLEKLVAAGTPGTGAHAWDSRRLAEARAELDAIFMWSEEK